MTKDEALREAIDTLKSTKHGNCDFAWIDETLKKCTEALAQPVQEPLAWMCSAFDGEPCEQTNHDECENPIPLYTTPPLPVQEQQQAEPVVWDIPSDNFNAWWDSDRRRDNANPFTTDSFSYWAWEGWQAALAQRQWVGLTEEEIMVIGDKVANEDLVGLVSNFRVRLARAIEQTLKEKNHG